jgi:hypothetical protein
MSDLDQLHHQLIRLPRREYSELIHRVDRERRQAVEREEGEAPTPGIDRDRFARWIGKRHYDIDKGITRVVYLPDNAPPDELRLLEVNSLAAIPENAPVTAVDFMPDIEGIHYKLFVADVTPGQFDAIEREELALPEGWSLHDRQDIIRDP